MAITTSTPTITTTVKVAGAPLQEYIHNAVTDTETTTTRYIEATAGQTFEIHADIAAGTEFIGDCLALYISVDGKMADPAMTFRSGERHAGSQVESKGCYTAGDMVRKYQFADIEKKSDGGVPTKEQVEAAMELGTIRIGVHHQISKSRVDQQLDLSSGLKKVGEVEGKALKGQAISSATSYTEAVANDDLHARYWDAEFVDPMMTPMAVFVFKYTSRADLQAMGMIERDSPPEPEEEAQPEPQPDVETMTQDEVVAELLERRRKDKDTAVPVKREREDDEQRPKQDKRFKTIVTLDDDGETVEVVTTMLPPPPVETIA